MTAGSERDLARALARTGDGAFVTDAHGRIGLWNRAAERLLGFTAREAAARGCCGVFCSVDAAGNRLCYPGCRARSRRLATRPVPSYDVLARDKRGTPVWLNVSTLPLGSARRPATLHLFRDVTAIRDVIGRRPADDPRAERLTRREREILKLLTEGATTSVMARRLGVSPATVRNHVQNLFAKLGVHSRLAAAAYANEHALF